MARTWWDRDGKGRFTASGGTASKGKLRFDTIRNQHRGEAGADRWNRHRAGSIKVWRRSWRETAPGRVEPVLTVSQFDNTRKRAAPTLTPTGYQRPLLRAEKGWRVKGFTRIT